MKLGLAWNLGLSSIRRKTDKGFLYFYACLNKEWMKNHRYCKFYKLQLLFGLLLLAQSLPAQEAVKLPVTLVRTQGEFEEETGAAFLIGQKESTLYFLTAAHVISDPNSIKVQFYKSATVGGQLVKSNQTLDIAVVSCVKPAGYTVPASFALAKSAEKNLQTVIVAGHPLGNYWDINFNSNVKSTDYDLDERLFTLAPIGIAPGNSGGPVLTQQYELLGLVTRVDQVNAVCVDVATLLRACQTWEVPVNLMTGIVVETKSQSGKEDFRYQIFVQEGNTAFAAKKWAQARSAFEQADALQASPEFKQKIQQCQIEMVKDEAYTSNMDKGKKAADLQSALGLFQEAQKNRDTEEVRKMVQQTKEKLAKLGLTQKETTASGILPERLKDKFAGEYALVRGGTFTMGCDTCEIDEAPAHQVYLDDYYMGVYELTIEQYCLYLNDQYSDAQRAKVKFTYKESNNSIEVEDSIQKKRRVHLPFGIRAEIKGLNNVFKPEAGEEKKPVWCPYNDAAEYGLWLSHKTGQTYRIPTEAEWEYAARGGIKSKHYKYPGNFKPKSRSVNDPLAITGQISPNELGLMDMGGNAAEYCSDWYNKENYYAKCKIQGVVANPVGPLSGGYRVLRNGASTNRHSERGSARAGFRLVRLPQPITQAAQVAAVFERNMQFVKGGAFEMGSASGYADNEPVHPVQLDDYFIGKTEVTYEQWDMVMFGAPRERDEYATVPVNGISWDMAQEFIKKLNSITGMNYRLPSEAEWEYAARGGPTQTTTLYAGSDNIKEVGWRPDRDKYVDYVAMLKPNALGLYDLSSNVSEWCNDWYHQNYYKVSPLKNPPGPPAGYYKVCRGGSFNSELRPFGNKDESFGSRNDLTVFTRNGKSATANDKDVRELGFRLARSISGIPPAAVFTDPFEKDMVPVKGGRYTIEVNGTYQNYTLDTQEVQVADFKMSKYEVTLEQWIAVLGYNPTEDTCFKCPVTNITSLYYNYINAFIEALNKATGKSYRLPTEVEWVYASGGGVSNRTTWSGTNQEADLPKYANLTYKDSKNKRDPYKIIAGGFIKNVGSAQPNALGLYDMTGNVSEFCEASLTWIRRDASLKTPYDQMPYIIFGGHCENGANGSNNHTALFSGRYSEPKYNGFRLVLSSK